MDSIVQFLLKPYKVLKDGSVVFLSHAVVHCGRLADASAWAMRCRCRSSRSLTHARRAPRQDQKYVTLSHRLVTDHTDAARMRAYRNSISLRREFPSPASTMPTKVRIHPAHVDPC